MCNIYADINERGKVASSLRLVVYEVFDLDKCTEFQTYVETLFVVTHTKTYTHARTRTQRERERDR